MGDSISYKLHSGKPNKLANFIKRYGGTLIPKGCYRMQLNGMLERAKKRPDYDYMLERRDYYLRLTTPFTLPGDRAERKPKWFIYVGRVDGFRPKMFHTIYYLDQRDVTRYFPNHYRFSFCPGDVYFTPEIPTIVKSRLLTENNQNSVILKLNKLRHFIFVNDPVPFAEKQDRAVFRGKVRWSRIRVGFMEKFFGSKMVDCGLIGTNKGWPNEWFTPKMTIRDHMNYKFIMTLEGNDVASNLKWVMSSNSVAVMTRPTCESWFMEGKLRPNYHYIEVKDDFSDLEERLEYYIQHPDEAQQIVEHAHEYVKQFQDKEREQLIQLMVLDRYFQLSGQKPMSSDK